MNHTYNNIGFLCKNIYGKAKYTNNKYESKYTNAFSENLLIRNHKLTLPFYLFV